MTDRTPTLPADLASPLADLLAMRERPETAVDTAASILELLDRELDRRGLALTPVEPVDAERVLGAERDDTFAGAPTRIARRVELELRRRGELPSSRARIVALVVEVLAADELAQTAAPASPAIVGAAVRFHDLEAFTGELKADRDLVERGLVRVAFRRRPILRGGHGPELLTMVAGAIVAGRYVRLELAIGELWGFDADKGVRDQAETAEAELRNHVEALGLELRAGVIEELER